jgi:hypothetical protein
MLNSKSLKSDKNFIKARRYYRVFGTKGQKSSECELQLVLRGRIRDESRTLNTAIHLEIDLAKNIVTPFDLRQ